jgi:hypothetical protein
MQMNYSIQVQIMSGEKTCGVVTISEYGRQTKADEWRGQPIDKFVDMCNRNGMKLIEQYRSSVGNRYLTFA